MKLKENYSFFQKNTNPTVSSQAARDLKVLKKPKNVKNSKAKLSHRKVAEEHIMAPDEPISRPMTPTEQKEETPPSFIGPSEDDLVRYDHFAESIENSLLEPLHEKSFQNIWQLAECDKDYQV